MIDQHGITWLLVTFETWHSCSHCHRKIIPHTHAVANDDNEDFHLACAIRLGWHPSDPEAWTMATYQAQPSEVH